MAPKQRENTNLSFRLLLTRQDLSGDPTGDDAPHVRHETHSAGGYRHGPSTPHRRVASDSPWLGRLPGLPPGGTHLPWSPSHRDSCFRRVSASPCVGFRRQANGSLTLHVAQTEAKMRVCPTARASASRLSVCQYSRSRSPPHTASAALRHRGGTSPRLSSLPRTSVPLFTLLTSLLVGGPHFPVPRPEQCLLARFGEGVKTLKTLRTEC